MSEAADAPTIPHAGIRTRLAPRLTARPTNPATVVGRGRPRPERYAARTFERLSDRMPGIMTTSAGKAACHSGLRSSQMAANPAGTTATAAMKVVSIASLVAAGAMRSASLLVEAEMAG